MKNKLLKVLINIFTACIIFVNILSVNTISVLADESNNFVNEAKGFIDGIIEYKLKESKAESVNQWIKGSLITNVGNGQEWYIFGLSQYGKYDFSSYETALVKYLSSYEEYSASSRQKYALVLVGVGSTNEYIYNTLNDSIGNQGIMSYVFGLHLLNNGYVSEKYSLNEVKNKLLSLQLSDGGFSIMGTNSDVDVTAMVIQALAPYYKSDTSVKNAIDKALVLLSERQLSDGDYSSYGVANVESTSQVLTALSALGIDCKSDSRFIKNGKSIFAGIEKYKLPNNTFCHKQGESYNDTATVQVFYSMISYVRMKEGKEPLYILDRRNPKGLKVPDRQPEKNDNSTTGNSNNNATNSSNSYETNTTKVNENSSNLSNQNELTKPYENPVKNTIDETTSAIKEERETSANEEEVISDESKDNGQEIEADDNNKKENISNSNDEKNKVIASKGEIKNNHKSNYKIKTTFIIFIISLLISGILFLLKKRNKNNFIFIAIVTVIIVVIVWITNIQTTKEYYDKASESKENVIGTVTLTISCDTIKDESENEFVPKDGIIIQTSEYEIEKGDTVYDILVEATAKNKIHIETTKSMDSIYVRGINYIYEFDYGDLSGWIYMVNGKIPSVGCSGYELLDGDIIEWVYSCNLGKDVEN